MDNKDQRGILTFLKRILNPKIELHRDAAPGGPVSNLSEKLQAEFCKSLLSDMKHQKDTETLNGLYEAVIVSFVFNHERIEGNQLSEVQTAEIFETRSTTLSDETTPSNVRETANHTLMFDYIVDHTDDVLSCDLIKGMHQSLMTGVMESAGNWKRIPNGVGTIVTARPEDVPVAMDNLVSHYLTAKPSVENICRLHARFEQIHPFPDGNGRVGRGIVFKECIKAGIVPFIVTDSTKYQYYESLKKAQTTGEFSDLVAYAEDRQLEFISQALPLMTDKDLVEKIRYQIPELNQVEADWSDNPFGRASSYEAPDGLDDLETQATASSRAIETSSKTVKSTQQEI